MSCLSTRLFPSPRRKPQQEKQHGPHHNSAISRPQTHAQPTPFTPPTSCLSTRLFSLPRRKPQQEKQHGPHHNSAISRPQTSRAADTFHTANVLPFHPIVFPSPPQTATGKATRSASQQCNQPPTNFTRSRHLSHRQRLASPPDCFPTLVAKVAGKQHDSQCKKSNPLRTTSRVADTFQSANVLPLHPIVFLRSSQTATEKANASGVDCATLSATAPRTANPEKSESRRISRRKVARTTMRP
jgi:hypothetical protein